MIEKIFNKLYASPVFRNFITPSIHEEKIARKIFLPAICTAIWFVIWAASATAAEPDLTKFFTVHEAKPVLIQTQDSDGQPIQEVRQISLLVQLPGERIARRILVSLDDNLLVDPRAPAPGEETYHGIVELDGSFTASPVARP